MHTADVARVPWQGSDARFLELLTKVVFCTGFRPVVVERRWEAFRRAFADFELAVVASFDEPTKEALVAQGSGIVRNVRKVDATVVNALICQQLAQEHESLARYVQTLLEVGEHEACIRLRTTFRQVGESAAQTLYRTLLAQTEAFEA